MKITKKIGNEFYTFEDDEIDKFAPKTFKEAFWGTIICTAVVLGVLFLIKLVGIILVAILS